MLLDLCCGRLILKGLCVDYSELPVSGVGHRATVCPLFNGAVELVHRYKL